MSDAQQSEEPFSPALGGIAALHRVTGPEVVDEAIQLARQNYGALLLAALVPWLPYFGTDIWTGSHREPIGLWPILFFNTIWSLWSSLAYASAARAAMDVLEGRSPDPARALRVAIRRALPVMLSGLCQVTIVLVGSILLLIPGLYLSSVLALIPMLTVVEPGLGAWQALHRSAALTKGLRRLTFGAYVVPCLFVFCANVALGMITLRFLGPHVGRLFGRLVGSGFTLATSPFIASIQVRLYVELRMRKEAIDIEWALASATPRTAAVS